jgi:hypothetical protein
LLIGDLLPCELARLTPCQVVNQAISGEFKLRVKNSWRSLFDCDQCPPRVPGELTPCSQYTTYILPPWQLGTNLPSEPDTNLPVLPFCYLCQRSLLLAFAWCPDFRATCYLVFLFYTAQCLPVTLLSCCLMLYGTLFSMSVLSLVFYLPCFLITCVPISCVFSVKVLPSLTVNLLIGHLGSLLPVWLVTLLPMHRCPIFSMLLLNMVPRLCR